MAALLESGGPAEVTHSAVARAAGVGRATVYRHWPSLDDLLADAIETRLGVNPPALTGDALVDLRALLGSIVDGVFNDDSAVFFSTLLVQGSDSAQLRAVRREVIGRRIGALSALVEQGISQGSVDPDLDAELAVSYLTGPIMHRRVVMGRAVDPEFVDDLLARITARHAPPRPAQRGGSKRSRDRTPTKGTKPRSRDSSKTKRT